LEALLDAFSGLPDPRVERTRAHPLVNIVVMALLATISGADGWEALELFAKQRKDFFATFLEMPKGTPSADTFRRVFEALEPKAFQDAFRRWLQPFLEHLQGQTIALDGKTLRGALAHAPGHRGAFHLVHVWATEERLLLGQKAVDGAAAEGSAALELLRMLDLGGATVTADAAYCTSEMTTAVREAGAHYVLSLKGNRDALHRHVRKRFADAGEASDPDVKLFKSRNAGHGRTEYRIVRAMPLGPLPARIKAPWTDLKTVVQIDRVRATDHMSVSRAYYITSHRADPKQLATRIRSHWSIENELHHCLDVSFADDRRGIRSKNGSQNFALINRHALSLLKREPSKMSVAMKRRKAAWGQSFFLDVLAYGFHEL
jgi:predicted transposase YbfD/YdcC